MFTCIGREREAELDMQRALDLDPLNIRLQESWGSDLLFLRRFEDSIKQIDSVLAREPKRYMSYLTLWPCYQALGRYDEAYQAFLGAWQSISDETIVTVLQQGHAAGGYAAAMLAAGRALAERAKTVSVMQIVTAMTFDFGGDSETALQWIERAHRTRDHAIAYFNRKPFSEKVTSDPRYRKLLRDLNLPL